jgi:hypothetical protein
VPVTNLSEDVQDQVAESQEAPVSDGQGEAGIEATSEAVDQAAPAYSEEDFLDTSQLGDRPVRITVDGEEQVVPLSDVLSGYNSNSAATKRFQEASSLREEAERSKAEAADALNLARAVSNDPGMTMRVLASQAGLSVEQFLNLTPQQQQDVAAASEYEDEPEFDDPLERALYEERQARTALEERVAAQEYQFQRNEANVYLQKSVNSLKSQFGANDEDAHNVVRQAYEMRVGPEMFPMIYQAQQYEKSQAVSSAQQEAAAAAGAETAARQAAAVAAGESIGAGTGAVGTAPQQVTQPMTAEEALNATFDKLGIQ